jgi:two-component system NtrC family sensor kinase
MIRTRLEHKDGVKFSIVLKLILVVALVELTIMLIFARIELIKRFPVFEAVLDTIILSIFIIIVFSYIIDKPLKSVLYLISSVQKGNLDVEIKINRTDEIGVLAKAFNEMIQNLKEQRTQLVAKAYVESIIAYIVESLIVVDSKGLITTVNKATQELLGYTEDELIGQQLARFLEAGEIRKILNEIQEIACLLSEDFKIIEVNDAFLKEYKLEEKDVINQTCYKITHHRDNICQPPYDICPVKGVINKNEPHTELHTHFDKEGKKSLVNAIAAPLRDKSGKVVYYLHLVSKVKGDIAEAQISPEGLKDIKALTDELEAYVEKLETARLFSEGALEALNRKGSVRNLEMYYKTKHGERIPISFSGSVMKDRDGNFTAIVIVARDMREIKRLELQLIRSKKLSAIGELAAGVAHEINNPLNVISGNAEILSKESQDRDVKLATKIIIEQVKRVAAITDSLLQFSKRREPKIELVDINKVIKDTLPLLEYQVRLQNIAIYKHLNSGLPEVMGDFGQLQQVFLNIMVNAVQAMPEGGRLDIRSYSKNVTEFGKRKTDIFKLGDKVVVIEFEDTGVGISEERLEKVFDPFFSTKEKGMGLGLSICHGIIEAHQGSIEAQSKLGKGTTFIIKLPILRKEISNG